MATMRAQTRRSGAGTCLIKLGDENLDGQNQALTEHKTGQSPFTL